MKNTFRSKVEIAIAIPVALALLVIEILMIYNQVWFLAALVAIITIFLLYIYLNTRYELTGDDKLRISSGFFYHKEIYIKSIRKIRETRNHFASPALSLDRIEILFNRYERVLISPDQRSEFINRLKKVNPRITVGG